MTEVPSERSERLLLREILKFYIPLALSFMILMSGHSIINSSLSRTRSPEISLAAYAVAMSIMNMLASPNRSSRQLLVARGYDQACFSTCKKIMFKTLLVTVFIMALVAFTPVGHFIFITVSGYPTSLYSEIIAAARICLALPFIYMLRAYSQGIIMVQKQTQYLTYAVFVRTIVMLILASFLPSTNLLTGASVGIFIWLCGMGTEAIVDYLFSRKLYKKVPSVTQEPSHPPVTQKTAFNFWWPLILMALIMNLAKPLLNAGLARTAHPEQALATYQVAYNFAWIFIALLQDNLRMVSLVFGKTANQRTFIRKFTLVLSVIIALIIGIFALTPLGTYTLTRFVGVEVYLADSSKGTLLVLMFLPLILAWVEYYMGVLMRRGQTKALSVAKMGSLVTTTCSVYALALWLPSLGATAGALAFVCGCAMELGILLYSAKFHK